MPTVLFGLAAAFVGAGFFADKAGDAAEQTGTSAVKVIAVGTVAFVIYKKLKG